MTRTRRALVVGLGIAGMSAAKRLDEIGWEVTIVERSSDRRTGGYFIAMFPTGRASAERMGFLEHIPNRAKADGRTWDVTRTGRKRPGMNFASIANGPLLITRGDVEAALFQTLPSTIQVRYGTVPTRITQHADSVTVTLQALDATEAEENSDFELGSAEALI